MRVLLATTLLLYSLLCGVDGQVGCLTSNGKKDYAEWSTTYRDILAQSEKPNRSSKGGYCAPIDPLDLGAKRRKREVPNEKCWSLMDASGIDVFNFPFAVSHRIHSLSLQDLRQFIDPDAPKANGIPTINVDQTSDIVILNNTRDDPSPFAASGLRALDSVLSNVKNLRYEIAKGSDMDKRAPLVMTRLIHEFHMQDLWALMKPIYDKLVANPPENRQLCPCITDIENNKVLGYLRWMSKGKALIGDGDVNAIDKGKKVEMFDANSIYSLWSEERMKLQKFHEAKDGSYSAAIFLYCMLNE